MVNQLASLLLATSIALPSIFFSYPKQLQNIPAGIYTYQEFKNDYLGNHVFGNVTFLPGGMKEVSIYCFPPMYVNNMKVEYKVYMDYVPGREEVIHDVMTKYFSTCNDKTRFNIVADGTKHTVYLS